MRIIAELGVGGHWSAWTEGKGGTAFGATVQLGQSIPCVDSALTQRECDTSNDEMSFSYSSLR